MTRLPLALEPLADESWASYLNRRAAQHRTTLACLGSHLALRGRRGDWPGRFGVDMSRDNIERVAPVLGLLPKRVAEMHLKSYDQLAFDLSGLADGNTLAGTRATVHRSWVWLAGSSFCPNCLAEDGGCGVCGGGCHGSLRACSTALNCAEPVTSVEASLGWAMDFTARRHPAAALCPTADCVPMPNQM
ncbi:TniQ family protein [Ornithinimicrobium sp. INDO-MA30-4]|uniref:TniQ family protein n=1 Tax=Ornithinimicrobium sp. INDO-MA30-4 TaxID=2908651 RepID=UPI0037C680BB